MSELTTGGINFGYQSPISQIYKDVEYKFKEDMENKIMEAVQHFGISVDKEELIKALQYDRNQYDKGYADGRASMVEELEKIKDKAINLVCDCCIYANECPKDIKCSQYTDFSKQINNHIAELKGENNG